MSAKTDGKNAGRVPQPALHDSKATAITVLRDIEVEHLGITLPHEHLIHRISAHSRNPDNTCVDVELVAEELTVFRRSGGGAVCDLTPVGLGRDPRALQEVSRKSGVHVVSGLGLYHLEVWPDRLRRMSPTQLADFLVRAACGEDTGIPAGLLGEISSHNEPDHADWRRYRLRDEEREVFQVVADVQRRTGLSVVTHASLGRAGVAQLRAIVDAGGDPRRVVIGHCDAQAHEDVQTDLEYYHTLLDEGAWLGFDLFGWDELLPDTERFRRVAALAGEGLADRLLISTDTCRLSQLHRHGGRGFDHLFTTVLPGLRRAGLSEMDVHRITVVNPAQILKCRGRIRHSGADRRTLDTSITRSHLHCP